MQNLASFVLSLSLGCAVAAVSPARADETVKTFPAGGASDILDKPEREPIGDAGGAIVKKADCRLNNGRIVRAEDPDYAKCTEMKGAGGKPIEKKAKKGEH